MHDTVVGRKEERKEGVLVICDLNGENSVRPIVVSVFVVGVDEGDSFVGSLGRENVGKGDVLVSVLLSNVVICCRSKRKSLANSLRIVAR
jgi:hypothetical protein